MEIEVAVEITIAGQKITMNDNEARELYIALKKRYGKSDLIPWPIYPNTPWPEYPVITYVKSNCWHL